MNGSGLSSPVTRGRIVAGDGGKNFLAGCAAVLAGLGLAPLLALLVGTLLAPAPYPNAARVRLRAPAIHLHVRGGCAQWTLVNKAYYAAPQDPARVVTHLRQSGWMRNYRYSESVLKQSNRRYGPVSLVRVNEIFVQNRSPGAQLISTMQTTLSLGAC